MASLLAEVIDAHGGLDRWRGKRMLSASFVNGGELFSLKGVDENPRSRIVRIELHRQWASVEPFARAGQRTELTRDRVAIEGRDGSVVAQRRDPRGSFARHDLRTCWDPLHLAYFEGYALWTYLTAPFLLAMAGFAIREIEPLREGVETLRGLRATFPPRIASHSTEQDFYFGPDMLLRRHDYTVEIAGGVAIAQYLFDPAVVDGVIIPTQGRAYLRQADRAPIMEDLMVSIGLSEFSFE
jgi:hypothetical protein